MHLVIAGFGLGLVAMVIMTFVGGGDAEELETLAVATAALGYSDSVLDGTWRAPGATDPELVTPPELVDSGTDV